MRVPRLVAVAAAVAVLAAACSASPDATPASSSTTATTQEAAAADEPETNSQPDLTFGAAPVVPEGGLSPDLVADLDIVFANLQVGFDFDVMRRIGESGDPRVAWLISDLLRFLQGGEIGQVLVDAFEELTGATIDDEFAWGSVTNHLIAWDVPAPPDYVKWKRIPFEIIEPEWTPFFDDPDATFDYRHLSWGGVLIDNRPITPIHAPCPRGCIPAMTEPPTTNAAGGSWYPDDGTVFGVVVNGEARAYPKNMMEVHEMVNDEIGGRRVAIPYCTLCGSAQAYLTDELEAIDTEALGIEAGRFEIRTSGLLSRSNKVMFELQTSSAFDTFTGAAVSGPLREAGVVLPEITVETARWSDWRLRYPETTIVSEFGVTGTRYPQDPLRGRDDEGPIFPIGAVDDRLGVHDRVLGVVLDDGTAIAFPVGAVDRAIAAGREVEMLGVRVVKAGGLRAELTDGSAVPSHEAFWFAWSQFHDTLLWDG